MKLIDQSATVWGQTPCDIEESILWIERAGRVCYRSEDKIVEGSGQKFVENIIKRKHYSVIEHSNIVVRTREKLTFPNLTIIKEKSVFNSPFFHFDIKGDQIYIAGNWRAWIEFIEKNHGRTVTLDEVHGILSSDTYEVVLDPNEVPNSLKAVTCEFVTDRAVTHELVRHRPASYSQESQRYVRYGDISFVKPAWFDTTSEDSFEQETFMFACEEAESSYGELIDRGLKAEDARVVLPNATATKIIMTAFIPEWVHVYGLRLSKAAYPQIRNLLSPTQQTMSYMGWMT